MAGNPSQVGADLLNGDAGRLLQFLSAFNSAQLPDTALDPPPAGKVVQKQNSHTAQAQAEESDDEKDEKDDSIPVGMLGECKPLFQIRDKNGRSKWVLEEPSDVLEAAEGKATAKYAFLVRKKMSSDSRKKYDIDSIIIQSPVLKDRLGVVLRNYPGVTTTLQRLVFQAPFQPFVHRWPELVKLLDPASTPDNTARQHLQLFHDVMYEELKNPISAKLDLVKNGVITFEYLWTILEPGSLIFGFESGKERVWQLNDSHTSSDCSGNYQQLNVWSVDQDAEKFGRYDSTLKVYGFGGTARITSLRAFPLDFHSQKQQIMKRLIERGRLFEKYAGYNFMHYTGIALMYARCGMAKVNLDSRVIIDAEAHNRFLPNHVVRVSTLPNTNQSNAAATPIDGGEDEDEDEDSYSDISADEYLPTPDSDTATDAKPKRRPLSEKELLLAVPYVRGYAIKAKTWFWLYVDQISPIKFNENAFETLVLDAGHKNLIKACVDTQRRYKDIFDDIITGKGRGMIMLLAGPPGVGKTLTAESVSEHLKVPLYMMSAGDLGLNLSSIEDSLNTVMDMVSKWNAVLLLDEADVFLEARSTHDLERNKLVSIFLRVLEYYEGILFLTTNRIKNIDDAFHSRIHLTINYPNLSAESRQHIWSTFLGPNTLIKQKEIEALARIDLNGRQIKNVIKIAQLLARSESDGKNSSAFRVEMKHVQTVLAVEKRGTSEQTVS